MGESSLGTRVFFFGRGDRVKAFKWHFCLILISGLSLLSRVSFAQSEVRFTLASELSSLDFPLLNKRSAVHLLQSSNGQCTSTTISDRGHQLTARHCLQHCLIRSKVFEWKKEQGLVDYFVTDPSRLGSATCRVSIDGKSQDIVIEATSPGLIVSLDEKSFSSINSDKFKILQGQGYTSEGDFVVFLPRGISEPQSCIGLDFAGEFKGEDLQSLGFPAETSRPDGFNANGFEMYLSRGLKTGGVEENECVKEEAPSFEDLRNLKLKFDQPTSFLSTLDASYGSSGSAVINDSLKVVGILIQTYRHTDLTGLERDEPDRRYCRGSAKALQTSSFLTHFPLELLRNLNCSN